MKRKGKSVQKLLGVKSFTENGIETIKGEYIFFNVQPTNISVLSTANVENKIRQLRLVFSSVPYLEILCTDSCECFDDNRNYLRKCCEKELNTKADNAVKRNSIPKYRILSEKILIFWTLYKVKQQHHDSLSLC